MRATVFLLFVFLIITKGISAQEPTGPVRSTIIERISGKEYYIHTIKKGETLYKISKDYETDMDEIISLNPEIKQGLKVGQTIRILVPKPARKEQPAPPQPPASEIRKDTVPSTTIAEPKCGSDRSKKKATYDVALMMHLYLDEIGTINTESVSADQESYEPTARPLQFIEFYEGFMMAVDSLEKQGLSIRIHVFDIDPDTTETKKFLKEPGLERMDLIIGMLFHRNFEIVADFAMKHRIPIVSPISERESQVDGNPWVFKVKPSLSTQDEQVAEFLSRTFAEAHIVIVRNSLSRVRETAENLQNACISKGLAVTMADGPACLDHLAKERKNVVIIISENKTYVLNLLTQLHAVKDQYEVIALGLPRWDRFEDLDYDYLSKLNTYVVAPVFIDNSSENVKRFTASFLQRYRTPPDVLAFTGHDVAYYFLTALMRFGSDFPRCLGEINEALFTGPVEMVRRPGGGYENDRWNIFYYSNFEVHNADTP